MKYMTYFNSLSDIKEWFVFVKGHNSCFCLHFWRKILRRWVILGHIFIFCFTHYSYKQILWKHIIPLYPKGNWNMSYIWFQIIVHGLCVVLATSSLWRGVQGGATPCFMLHWLFLTIVDRAKATVGEYIFRCNILDNF